MALNLVSNDPVWSDGKPFTFILGNFAAAGQSHVIGNFSEAEATLQIAVTTGGATVNYQAKWRMIRATVAPTTVTVVVLATDLKLPISVTNGATLATSIRGPVAMFKGTSGNIEYEDLAQNLPAVQT